MKTFFATSGVANAALLEPTTDANFKLGTRCTGNDGTEWIYVQANGAITVYDAVGIDETFQAAALTKAMADADWRIGFAQVAFTDNQYGWVATSGAGSNFKVNVLASCVADAALYTTATAGALDDDATSQTAINGVVIVTTNGGATAAVAALATNVRSAT